MTRGVHRARRLVAALFAAALVAPCSCAADYVAGLSFRDSSGRELRVSNASDGGSRVASGEIARFRLELEYVAGRGEDMAILLRGYGTVVARLMPEGRDPEPIASAEARLTRGEDTELRLRLEPGVSVSSIEVAAFDGSAEALSFAVSPVFEGYARDGARVTIGRGVSAAGETGRYSVRTPLRDDEDYSITTRLRDGGTVRLFAVGRDGRENQAYAATVRAGDPLAVPAAFFGEASAIVVESEAQIASVGFEDGGGAPLSDLHAVLSMPAPAGDYAIYRWDVLPRTLVLDFADYDTQDLYLKRLAFFAEKPGFRGRLASDDEIAGLHGWNAHDYPTFTLARFFALADESGFALNAEEERFRDLLLEYGVVRLGSGGVPEEGEGAVISITRESSDELRRRFIDHEASHALFFQDPAYRELSARLWAGHGPEASYFWKTHFAWRSYDVRDEYLCVNELQAYLMQQSLEATLPYFKAVSLRVAGAYPERAERLSRDEAVVLESIRSDGIALDEYLRLNWGLSAGSFGRSADGFGR